MSISNEVYKFFADYIYNKTGINYTEKDYYRLDSRFRDLITFFELEDANQLYELYKENITPDMHAVLINISTNNETYFFRDKKPFKALIKHIIPELSKNKSIGFFNIWSAAASTGQEALSILMTLADKNPEFYAKTKVDASDISKEALDKAKKGIYNGLDIQRGLPITTLMKHFIQMPDEENIWQVSKDLHSKINYFEFNLLNGIYNKSKYDVIYCRNVLIYQDKENKQVILEKIFEALKPGGYMILGNGESLIGMSLKFEKEMFDGLTLYRRPME